MIIPAKRVAETLGLKQVRDLAELRDAIAHGPQVNAKARGRADRPFEAGAASSCARHCSAGERVSRREERLTPAQSECTEPLARVYATACYVWADESAARRFMETPQPMPRSSGSSSMGFPLERSLTAFCIADDRQPPLDGQGGLRVDNVDANGLPAGAAPTRRLPVPSATNGWTMPLPPPL